MSRDCIFIPRVLSASVKYRSTAMSPHPKTQADRQTSAGKFGIDGGILEIRGETFGHNRAIHWAI